MTQYINNVTGIGCKCGIFCVKKFFTYFADFDLFHLFLCMDSEVPHVGHKKKKCLGHEKRKPCFRGATTQIFPYRGFVCLFVCLFAGIM